MTETKSVVFTVEFVRGQSRPKFSTRPFPHAYKVSADERAERELREAAIERIGKDAPQPFFGKSPVGVQITCYEPLPASKPRSVASEPFTKKPDVDNIAKLVLDALNGVMWADDAQIVHLDVTKGSRTRLFPEPQTSIRVYRLKG